MAASHETVDAVITVLRRHVDAVTLHKIVKDLLHVQGNPSFRETIRRIALKLVEEP